MYYTFTARPCHVPIVQLKTVVMTIFVVYWSTIYMALQRTHVHIYNQGLCQRNNVMHFFCVYLHKTWMNLFKVDSKSGSHSILSVCVVAHTFKGMWQKNRYIQNV